MNIKEKLETYSSLEEQIHEYFGYKEGWVTIPIHFLPNQYWYITGEQVDDCVYFHEDVKTLKKSDGDQYSYSFYHQRHLEKYIYRKDDFTMIVCDTHVDGNVYLAIFDNKKEI